MIISDLQHIESVESNQIIGGYHKKGKYRDKGKYKYYKHYNSYKD
ncbi:hypothetical protein NIES4106_35410 [Fischerella sp. NIES-4106]|jgi:hypothetical protein|nr:hypothetical protein NIES4106_35410 [Fischerella sp. NIES-4106]